MMLEVLFYQKKVYIQSFRPMWHVRDLEMRSETCLLGPPWCGWCVARWGRSCHNTPISLSLSVSPRPPLRHHTHWTTTWRQSIQFILEASQGNGALHSWGVWPWCGDVQSGPLVFNCRLVFIGQEMSWTVRVLLWIHSATMENIIAVCSLSCKYITKYDLNISRFFCHISRLLLLSKGPKPNSNHIYWKNPINFSPGVTLLILYIVKGRPPSYKIEWKWQLNTPSSPHSMTECVATIFQWNIFSCDDSSGHWLVREGFKMEKKIVCIEWSNSSRNAKKFFSKICHPTLWVHRAIVGNYKVKL